MKRWSTVKSTGVRDENARQETRGKCSAFGLRRPSAGFPHAAQHSIEERCAGGDAKGQGSNAKDFALIQTQVDCSMAVPCAAYRMAVVKFQSDVAVDRFCLIGNGRVSTPQYIAELESGRSFRCSAPRNAKLSFADARGVGDER